LRASIEISWVALLLIGCRSPERVELFNGRDLEGWTTWLVDTEHDDPRGVYSVADGMIRISGDGFGYLATKETFGDFHLRVEFRWGESNHRGREGKARDSGLFLRSVGPDGNSFDGGGAFCAAIECQIMEGAVGDFLLIRGDDESGNEIPVTYTTRSREKDADGWPYFSEDPSAEAVVIRRFGRVNRLRKNRQWSDTLECPDPSGLERAAPLWNVLECECRGDTIRVHLNGEFVNEVTAVYPLSGRILLQCEGSEIFFREVSISQ